MAKATEQQIRLGSDDAVLVTYPPALSVPTSPSLRYQTPGRALPSSFSDTATADPLNGVVDTAAEAGASTIVFDLETTNTFNPDFDVVDARNAVSLALQALGSDDGIADADAANLVIAGRTVEDFLAAATADRVNLSDHCGHPLTDEELLDLVVAYESIVLTVTTPSWVRGRLYLVKTAAGPRFTVEAAISETSTTLHTTSPIPFAVAVGDTVNGFAILSDAIPSANTGAVGRGVAEWRATLDDVVYQWGQDLRVVARNVAYQLTAATVARISPVAQRLRPENDDAFDEIIDFAWQYGIVPQLIVKGLRPERIVSWEAINPWHLAEIEKRLAILYETDETKRTEVVAAALTAANLALSGSQFWYDAGDDLAVPASDAPQGWNVSLVSR